MPTVTQDSKITRGNFNDLVAKFNSIWSDDAEGQMFTPRASQNPNYTWTNKGWGATTGRLGKLASRLNEANMAGFGLTWAQSQSYLEGQLILHNSVIWLCLTNHTSANSNRPDVDPNTWSNYETDDQAQVQQHLDNVVTYADWSIFGNAVNAALIHCGLPIIPATALPVQHQLIRGILYADEYYYNMISTKIDQMFDAATNGFTGNGVLGSDPNTFYYRGLTRKASNSAEKGRLIGLTTTAGWGVNDYRTFSSGLSQGGFYPNFTFNNQYDGDPVWAQQGKWQVAYVRLTFDNQTQLRHYLNQGGTITVNPYYVAHASPRSGDTAWQHIVGEIGTIEFGGMHVRRIFGSDEGDGSTSIADYLQAYGDGGLLSEYVGSGGGSAQGAWKTWVSSESAANAYWEDTTAGTITLTQDYPFQWNQNHTTFRRKKCTLGCGTGGTNYQLQIIEGGSVNNSLTQKFATQSDTSMPSEFYTSSKRYSRGAHRNTWTEVIPDPTPGGGQDTHYEYMEYELKRESVGFTVGTEEDYANTGGQNETFGNLGTKPLLSTGNFGQGARRRLEVVSRLGPGSGDNWYIDCGIRLFNKSENKYNAQVGVNGYYTNVQASMYPITGGPSTTIIYPISFTELQDGSGTGDPPTVTALDSSAGTW